MDKNFHAIITGFGGQGLMTLINIAATSAFIDGYDVKSSELHGLSQRGGSVATYLSFGKKVYSPLFKKGDADLVMGLELLEGLRGADFANSQTKILINNYFSPFIGITPKEKIIKRLEAIGKSNLKIIEATKICNEKLGKDVLAGTYLFGYAVYNKMLPIRAESCLKAIEKIIPEKYWEMNKNAFNLAQNG